MNRLDEQYWETRYESGETTWDVGHISTPLKTYFNQIRDPELKILIPGGGNSYEAEYLAQKGFTNVFLLDIAQGPLENLKGRVPNFPPSHLIHQNFFNHHDQYDLIVEQTFFCALDPSLRPLYSRKMFELLKPGGKLVGLLFDDLLTERIPPPFGGTRDEYIKYFEPYFYFKVFEHAYNSIEPRKNRELFMILVRKEKAETS